MLLSYFREGGPLMLGVLAAWVVVFAGILDRLVYAAGRLWRRPGRKIGVLAAEGRLADARDGIERERSRAERGTERIDAVSQLATSIGLFGTVFGIARAFFAQGSRLAVPDALASGLSTALFTTIGGLSVFLLGQAFLIAWREGCALAERGLLELVAAREQE